MSEFRPPLPPGFPPGPPPGFPLPPGPPPGGFAPLPPLTAGNAFPTIPASTLAILFVYRDYLMIMVAILVWDTMATMSIEREFIWKAKWSALKLFYLVNRYFTLALAITTSVLIQTDVPVHICAKIAGIEIGGIVVTLMSCAAILTIRVWAIFERSIRILVLYALLSFNAFGADTDDSLCTLMVAELVVLVLATLQFTPRSLPASFPGCVLSGKPGSRGLAIAFWLAPLLFDTVIMCLTIYRVLWYRRVAGVIKILENFLQQAGLYYTIIFVVDLVNILFYAQKNPALQSINSGASLVLTSLMASRIVLHLHTSKLHEPNSSLNGRFTERDEQLLAQLSRNQSPKRSPPRHPTKKQSNLDPVLRSPHATNHTPSPYSPSPSPVSPNTLEGEEEEKEKAKLDLDEEWERAVANHSRLKGSSFMHLDDAAELYGSNDGEECGKRSSKSLSLRDGVGIRVEREVTLTVDEIPLPTEEEEQDRDLTRSPHSPL